MMATEKNVTRHQPVMLQEVLEHLAVPRSDRDYRLMLDCTLGGGGHSEAILAQVSDAFLLGLDRDRAAITRVEHRLAPHAGRFHLVKGSFSDLTEIIRQATPSVESWCKSKGFAVDPLQEGELRFDGILADLGISSDQLDEAERGFSFMSDGPLDMRMDRDSGITAAELLNTSSVDALRRMFKKGGVGTEASALARSVLERRPIGSTAEFSQLCRDVIKPSRNKTSSHHPATVPFQALRIAVNKELEELDNLLKAIPQLLAPGGRVAIICFHSLEDQYVARSMRAWERVGQLPPKLPIPGEGTPWGRLLSKQALTPSENEIAENVRSRSARLRVFERSISVDGGRVDVGVS